MLDLPLQITIAGDAFRAVDATGIALGHDVTKAVQTRAGHATLALTLDTYGHLLDANDGDQIAAAEKLVLGS